MRSADAEQAPARRRPARHATGHLPRGRRCPRLPAPSRTRHRRWNRRRPRRNPPGSTRPLRDASAPAPPVQACPWRPWRLPAAAAREDPPPRGQCDRLCRRPGGPVAAPRTTRCPPARHSRQTTLRAVSRRGAQSRKFLTAGRRKRNEAKVEKSKKKVKRKKCENAGGRRRRGQLARRGDAAPGDPALRRELGPPGGTRNARLRHPSQGTERATEQSVTWAPPSRQKQEPALSRARQRGAQLRNPRKRALRKPHPEPGLPSPLWQRRAPRLCSPAILASARPAPGPTCSNPMTSADCAERTRATRTALKSRDKNAQVLSLSEPRPANQLSSRPRRDNHTRSPPRSRDIRSSELAPLETPLCSPELPPPTRTRLFAPRVSASLSRRSTATPY